MPSIPHINRYVGYARTQKPCDIHYVEGLEHGPGMVAIYVSDVLAMHDAGITLHFNASAMRRFVYARKQADWHLDPFTKIPLRRQFKTTDDEEDRYTLQGMKGMPGRTDAEGLTAVAGIAWVYRVLMQPQAVMERYSLCLPFGGPDANMERCALIVQMLVSGGLPRDFRELGSGVARLANALMLPHSMNAVYAGIRASIGEFEKKISQLTRSLPRRFEDGSLAFSE